MFAAALRILAAAACVLGLPVRAVDTGSNTLRQALDMWHEGVHHRHRHGGGERFRHRLRVCNAYPYNSAMDVYVRGGEKLTKDKPMPYGSCEDFLSPISAGNKIEFKVGEASAGTFSVSDLPNNDAILLLVIYRHDTLTTAVSFQSHVFANLLNAQIALIDTYKGTLHAVPRIMDMKGTVDERRSEELRFDSVVAVNPGIYELELTGQGSHEDRQKETLVALNRESYVVLRMGVEAQRGPSFPEQVTVFPKSDPSALQPAQSGAGRAAWGALALVLPVASAVFAVVQ
jgi:predicted  nucleic acid-binding Zn-ribbon protein